MSEPIRPFWWVNYAPYELPEMSTNSGAQLVRKTTLAIAIVALAQQAGAAGFIDDSKATLGQITSSELDNLTFIAGQLERA